MRQKTIINKGLALALVSFFAAGTLLQVGCGGSSSTVTSTVTETTVKTVTATVTVTETDTQAASQSSQGPYSTESAAENYIQSQQDGMQIITPDSTWNPQGALHVLHATPTGGASYGGDYYYFFVDGNAVGNKLFTSASTDGPVDSTTFSVTFNVYQPSDPHCCPSGGTSTVQFQWDGSQLVTMGSMQGAEMS